MLDLRQAQSAVAAATRKNYETGYIQLTADQVLESACKRVWVYIICNIRYTYIQSIFIVYTRRGNARLCAVNYFVCT